MDRFIINRGYRMKNEKNGLQKDRLEALKKCKQTAIDACIYGSKSWITVNDIEWLMRENERLQNKYEEPGQKCNAGHKNTLPVSLWDCPMCTEKLRKEKEWFIHQLKFAYKDRLCPSALEERVIEMINKDMQQALKEE